MATLPTKAGAVTLTDFAKSIDPDGSVASVIELLNQTNPALLDIPWKEGNLPTGHQTTIRTSLPSNVWRRLYRGVPASKSGRAQVVDAVAMMEARSEIDVDVAKLNGNTAAFRLSEAEAFVEGMNQEFMSALFYGNSAIEPEKFTGLAPRYNTLDPLQNISSNVLDAGGTGTDNTSIYLVVWGENTVTGIYPKGSMAGLDHQDLGEIDAFDENNNRYRAYADLWKWKVGLSVRDWRYVVRIANIDVSDLKTRTGTQADTAATNIIDLMTLALGLIPNPGKGQAVFYGNRAVLSAMPLMAKKIAQNVLAVEGGTNQFGEVGPGWLGAGGLRFLGVPVRTTDALLTTEAAVTA